MKNRTKNILCVGIIAIAAMVTATAVDAKQVSDDVFNARCAQWASIAGDKQTAKQHARIAKVTLEPGVLVNEIGYASGYIAGLNEVTGIPDVELAKKIYLRSNCKSLLFESI